MNPSLLRVLSVALVASACAPAPSTAPVPVTMPAASPASGQYDVVIRNGRVLDGAGNPWILADVAIKDGRFAKIGRS